MLGVPQESGSVYTIVPADDETRVKRAHRTMLKAVEENPLGHVSPHGLLPQEESPPEEEPSFEYDLLFLGQPSSGTVPARSLDRPTTSQVPPPVPADDPSSLLVTRQTAGQHSNVHHLPRPVGDVHVANPSVSASNSVSAFFRPWS